MQKTGAKVVVAEGWTSASIAKVRAEKANPSTSVYLMDDIGVVTTGREGLLEPLDLSRLPNAVDVQPRFFIEGKGAGFFTYVTGLAYNTELVKTPPTSWQELWDPKYKGKIAIPPAGAGPALHMAIIAAMVNGGSQYNMAPAWDALKALKPNVAVMEQSAAILARAPADRRGRARHAHGLPVQAVHREGLSDRDLAGHEGRVLRDTGLRGHRQGAPGQAGGGRRLRERDAQRRGADADGEPALVRADQPQGEARAGRRQVPGQHARTSGMRSSR